MSIQNIIHHECSSVHCECSNIVEKVCWCGVGVLSAQWYGLLSHCTPLDTFPVASSVFDDSQQLMPLGDNLYSTVNVSQRNLLLTVCKQTSGTVSECNKQPVLQDNPSYFWIIVSSFPRQPSLPSGNPACMLSLVQQPVLQMTTLLPHLPAGALLPWVILNMERSITNCLLFAVTLRTIHISEGNAESSYWLI